MSQLISFDKKAKNAILFCRKVVIIAWWILEVNSQDWTHFSSVLNSIFVQSTFIYSPTCILNWNNFLSSERSSCFMTDIGFPKTTNQDCKWKVLFFWVILKTLLNAPKLATSQSYKTFGVFDFYWYEYFERVPSFVIENSRITCALASVFFGSLFFRFLFSWKSSFWVRFSK